MEFEYQDPTQRRGKFIVVVGLILAIIAGAAAFYLVQQARSQVEQGGQPMMTVVVAKQQIPARKPIEESDLDIAQVPGDPTTNSGAFTDPSKVIGLVPMVPILQGQPVYANLLASDATSSGITILQPGETIGPDSEAWRAVSITVPDDRAVGGFIKPGDMVDVFVTAPITVPPDLAAKGRYTSDHSTKITYQDIDVLARSTSSYVIRVPLRVAEEINHLQAVGTVSFSLDLRPTEDTRIVDVSALGETTDRIIQRYGLPIPQVYPGSGPIQSAAPLQSATPGSSPEPSASAPAPSFGPLGSPTPAP